MEQAAGSLTFEGAVCYLSLGLQGPSLLSREPSAGLSFPSLFYSLAMLYDSASSEPHKSSLRKETAGEKEKKGVRLREGGKKQKGGHRAQLSAAVKSFRFLGRRKRNEGEKEKRLRPQREPGQ